MILWILHVILIVSYGLRIVGLRTHNMRLFCYIDYWAIENDAMKFEEINAALDKCTHLVYMYADIDEETFRIVAYDEDRQLLTGRYERSVAVKSKHTDLKVLIAIGGPGYSKILSKICSTQSSRKTFLRNVVDFLKKFSFDGIELRWRALGTGPAEDGKNLILLSKDLKPEFDRHGLIFSFAGSSRKDKIDAGPNPKELSEYVHYYSVPAYGYHGFYKGTVNPTFLLHSNDTKNVDFNIQHYLRKGVAPNKIILGLSNYFDTFMTTDPVLRGTRIVGISSKISESHEGPITINEGSIAYYELCMELEKNAKNWTLALDSGTKSPFAFTPHGDFVVSIETRKTYEEKVKYAVKNKLGGVSYFSLDKDDFRSQCKTSKKPYPLLTSIERAFRKYLDVAYEDIRRLAKMYSSVFFWNGMKL